MLGLVLTLGVLDSYIYIYIYIRIFTIGHYICGVNSWI